MSHALTVAPAVTPCGLHRRHSPQPWTTELHHVVLESWTDKLGLPPSRLMPLCPTGHDAIHVAIRLLVGGRPLPYPMTRAMRGLVEEAAAFWEAHPGQLTLDEEGHAHG